MMEMFENIEEIENGVQFYFDLNKMLNDVKTFSDVKNVVKYFMIDNTMFHESKYNIIQASMKICIHRIWQLCYRLHPRLRSTPEEAIHDALYPIETSQQIVKDIIESFSKK